MTKIKTEDCKQAIVEFVNNNPGHVSKQFCDIEDQVEFEKPARKTASWKRQLKQKVRTQTIPSVPVGSIKRMYECSATEEAEELYEDMLRAYTYDDGEKILHIEVVGE